MSRRIKKVGKYRSKFEQLVAEQLKVLKAKAEYETKKIKYTTPATEHTYTPDWVLPNGIIIEAKGRFTTSDRKKHLLIKEQHPELDIRFVFQRASQPIYKHAKTSYADWCDKNGFKYSDKIVPKEWMKKG